MISEKAKFYDVQIKAVKPKKVVTVARFTTLERAQEVRDQLTTIGFEVLLSWKIDENAD
jgi:hypothetical protein